MRGAVCLFLVFLVGLAQGSQRPNVVVVYTDDQGYGDASCNNAEAKFSTPHFDALAAEGVRFTDAHASDTVCTPSRYGLLTGRYSWRTTLKRGVFGAERACLITDDTLTLPGLLRAAGYATAMSGKWHLGMDFPGTFGARDWSQPVRDMPLDKGFDYFFGIPASMNYGVLAWFEGRFTPHPPVNFTAKKPNRIALSDYRIMPPYAGRDADVDAGKGRPVLEVAPDFVDELALTRFTDKAISWVSGHVKERPEQPFFLYLSLTSPHKPVIPRADFRGRSSAGSYGDFMIETDAHLGRLLLRLSELGVREQTCVIVTSDNGPETTWRERAKRFSHQSNGPFREGKRSIYEGGHRVPFLVSWPAGIQDPGRVFAGPVCQTDLLATMAEVVGQSLPENAGVDSESFAHVLRNEAPTPRGPLMHHAANGRLAVRQGSWKLVLPHRAQPAELYRLDVDPGEQRECSAAHPDRVEQLLALATNVVTRGRSTEGPSQANDTDYWDDVAWLTAAEYRHEVASHQGVTPSQE